jgi:aldose 1-epimerase
MIEPFGHLPTGEEVHQISIGTDGLSVSLLTLGACLQQVQLPGIDRNLTLGFPTLHPYLNGYSSAGTIMGPVANRIGGAKAVIDGTSFAFDRNFLGAHTLHGGRAAVHTQVWEISEAAETRATLTLELPDGAGGFPGNRTISARFEVQDAALTLTLTATTDAATLMNLANHSYWNLGPEQTTQGHVLSVDAKSYTPVGDESSLIPIGTIASVQETRFDFRQGRKIEAGAEGLLDTNLCLSEARRPLQPVATLTGPDGTAMEIATTEPGLQVFDGHILGALETRTTDGRVTQPYCALALEAQFWPDAPNHPGFPSIVLHAGEAWEQVTRWRFVAA